MLWMAYGPDAADLDSKKHMGCEDDTAEWGLKDDISDASTDEVGGAEDVAWSRRQSSTESHVSDWPGIECTSQTLTTSDALMLQRDLMTGFTSEDFQKKLLALLRENGGPDASWYLEGREELCLTVQQKVLPKYGFAGTSEGVQEMTDVLRNLMPNSEELVDGQHKMMDALGMADVSPYAPWSM
mmetsp:Transcript_28709/g.52854  ORF Transcript_28709/g.52854 Transcript_28709/m.52854 type:complete len:184 (-) Transcript_28709:41-592(-)